jgi:hypothetical protein
MTLGLYSTLGADLRRDCLEIALVVTALALRPALGGDLFCLRLPFRLVALGGDLLTADAFGSAL